MKTRFRTEPLLLSTVLVEFLQRRRTRTSLPRMAHSVAFDAGRARFSAVNAGEAASSTLGRGAAERPHESPVHVESARNGESASGADENLREVSHHAVSVPIVDFSASSIEESHATLVPGESSPAQPNPDTHSPDCCQV